MVYVQVKLEVTNSPEELKKRIADTDAIIAKLEQAQANINGLSATLGKRSVYSKLNTAQAFNSREETTAAAQQFFKTYTVSPPNSRLDSTYGDKPIGQSVDRTTHAFYGTEVKTKRGIIPVGVLQETNTDQTYSEQKVMIDPAVLKLLNDLPLGAQAKSEKIREQLVFVSNMIETGLDAIKTNGPVRIDNWPPNLQKVAAAYCKEMGYDLNPRSIAANMKPKEMEKIRHLIKAETKNNPSSDFSKLVHEAEKRQDLKNSELPHTSPRPR